MSHMMAPCPNCRTQISVDLAPNVVGMTVKCQHCGQPFEVNAPANKSHVPVVEPLGKRVPDLGGDPFGGM